MPENKGFVTTRARTGGITGPSLQPTGSRSSPAVWSSSIHSRGLMPATPLSQVAVHLRPDDNVAVAARPLAPGSEVRVNGRTVTVHDRVGLGHKLALCDIRAGEAVTKYGQI